MPAEWPCKMWFKQAKPEQRSSYSLPQKNVALDGHWFTRKSDASSNRYRPRQIILMCVMFSLNGQTIVLAASQPNRSNRSIRLIYHWPTTGRIDWFNVIIQQILDDPYGVCIVTSHRANLCICLIDNDGRFQQYLLINRPKQSAVN